MESNRTDPLFRGSLVDDQLQPIGEKCSNDCQKWEFFPNNGADLLKFKSSSYANNFDSKFSKPQNFVIFAIRMLFCFLWKKVFFSDQKFRFILLCELSILVCP